MALAVKRIYEQMPEPKWSSPWRVRFDGAGFRFLCVLQGIDQLLP